MRDPIINLYDCKHCNGTGTCSNGLENTSCECCAKKNELPFWRRKKQVGLICGCCGGIGKAELLTDRMNKRVTPLLAIYLVVMILGTLVISIVTGSQYSSELLAFSSAIIGSICGFYFSAVTKEGK